MPESKIPDKRWSIDLEKRIQQEHYADENLYNERYGFNPDSGKEIFVIDTPPPYPSGTWHIGAVAQYSMIDVIARSQRLLGKEVSFPWGVDRNGINVEFTVEKNTKRKMKTYDRAEFLELCRETIETFTQSMRDTARRVGLSMDFANEYLTDAPNYRAVTQAIFTDLFKRGEIIEDLRPNIYDPVEGTTIADAEVERLTRKTKLVDVIWETSEGEKVIISTTRPELICACGIVVVHPDDQRYTHLVGQEISLPLEVSDRSTTVKIATHPSVKSEFGSGVLMVCSFGDQNDVSVFRELGLNPFQAIDLEGKMTKIAGPLAGMSVMEARASAIEQLNRVVVCIKSWKRTKRSLSQKEEKILLKSSYSKNGMYVKPTCRIRFVNWQKILNSTHQEISNSYSIGWIISALIGRFLVGDGIIPKYQFGIPKMTVWL